MGEYSDYEAGFLNLGAAFDHSSIVVYSVRLKDHRRTSFKFFKFWAYKEGFLETVQTTWAIRLKGNPMFILVQKLKIVKYALIWWNKDRVCNVVDRVQEAKQELDRAQSRLQTNLLDRGLIQKEKHYKILSTRSKLRSHTTYRNLDSSVLLQGITIRSFFISVQQ